MEKIKITMKNIYEETIYKKKIYTIYPKKKNIKKNHTPGDMGGNSTSTSTSIKPVKESQRLVAPVH